MEKERDVRCIVMLSVHVVGCYSIETAQFGVEMYHAVLTLIMQDTWKTMRRACGCGRFTGPKMFQFALCNLPQR